MVRRSKTYCASIHIKTAIRCSSTLFQETAPFKRNKIQSYTTKQTNENIAIVSNQTELHPKILTFFVH